MYLMSVIEMDATRHIIELAVGNEFSLFIRIEVKFQIRNTRQHVLSSR